MSEEIKLEVPCTTSADQIYDLHDRIQVEFVKQLHSEAGKKAMHHLLEERKMPAHLIERFGLGYIPNGQLAMRDVVVKLQLSLERAADANLLKRDAWKVLDAFKKSNKREPINSQEFSNFFMSRCKEDRFYYRDYHCIFPEEGKGALFGEWLVIPVFIKTSSGIRIGGFQLRSARPIEEIGKMGRYRNPVNTVAMTWNDVLVGLVDDEENLAATNEVILCEGGFDRFATIAALETKFKDGPRPAVVALNGINVRGGKSEGSAMEKAGILSKIKAKRSILLLDQDKGGTESILTIGPRLSDMGQFVSVCRIEDGWEAKDGPIPKDAGELWEEKGASSLLAVLEAGRGRGLITYAAGVIEQELLESIRGGRAWERLNALDSLLPILETSPPTVRKKAAARVAEVVSLPLELIEKIVISRGNQQPDAPLVPASTGAPAKTQAGIS